MEVRLRILVEIKGEMLRLDNILNKLNHSMENAGQSSKNK